MDPREVGKGILVICTLAFLLQCWCILGLNISPKGFWGWDCRSGFISVLTSIGVSAIVAIKLIYIKDEIPDDLYRVALMVGSFVGFLTMFVGFRLAFSTQANARLVLTGFVILIMGFLLLFSAAGNLRRLPRKK